MKAHIVTSASSSIEEASAFYRNLGYTKHSTIGDYVYFSDSQMVIEVNSNSFVRSGIRLFKTNWQAELDSIQELIDVFETKTGHAFRDFNGMWVYLEKGESVVKFDNSIPKAHAGTFMGISLECTNFRQSITLYEKLGFKLGTGTAESGFVTMQSDLGIGLSLMKPFMCPHKFINPSLTFFNGKQNTELIKLVLKAGITPFEIPTAFGETEEVENIILRDEGGYGIFMFSD